MITFLSGLPGSGKSLSIIGTIRHYRSQNRRVYVRGVPELDFAALDCLEWDKPFSEWTTMQKGDVLIWDEIQDELKPYVGKTSVPDWMSELSKHRHHGVDFVLCSQRPGYIPKYVRGLVGEHVHLLRKWGADMSWRYRFDELQVDPFKTRKLAVRSIFRFPKEDFQFYKSAELHTVEKKFPKRILAAAILVPVCIALFVVAFRMVSPKKKPEEPVKAVALKSDAEKVSVSARKPGFTRAEYAERFTPRISSMPWSANAYDARAVVAEPEIYCIQMQLPDRPEKLCHCMSEQGTKLVVEQDVCERVAKDGVYNAFRKPNREFAAGAGGRGVDVDGGRVSVRPERWPELQSLPDAGVTTAAAKSSGGGTGRTWRGLRDSYNPDVFGPKGSMQTAN